MKMKHFNSHFRENSFTRYGGMPEKYKKLIKPSNKLMRVLEETKVLATLEEDIPPNDGDSLVELEYLKRRMKNISTEELEFARRSEKKEVLMYVDLAESIGLSLQRDFIDDVFDFVNPLLFHLKEHHDRGRPFQLAKKYGIEFHVLIDHTANHPSYPSGHCYDARIIQHIFTEIRPIKKDEIREFCDKMASSRLDVGLHYPSDNDYSERIAKRVFDTGLLDIFTQRLSE